MNHRILAEALAELDEAAGFYDSRESGLGFEFVAEVRETIRRITTDPTSWPKILGQFRRCRVRRFPYDVIFRVRRTEFVVVAVAHHHRNPLYWRRRQ